MHRQTNIVDFVFLDGWDVPALAFYSKNTDEKQTSKICYDFSCINWHNTTGLNRYKFNTHKAYGFCCM